MIRNKTWPFMKCFMHIHIVEYYRAIKKNEKGVIKYPDMEQALRYNIKWGGK